MTGRLSDEAMAETLSTAASFVAEAKSLGATDCVVTATSAARDAANRDVLLSRARAELGCDVEVLSGTDEARLTFASAYADFGGRGDLAVIDVGGGSTEVIYGGRDGAVHFSHSFDIGSVRFTEKFLHGDPPTEGELAQVRRACEEALGTLKPPGASVQCVGVAGTVTSLLAVARRIEPYDGDAVQGAMASVEEFEATVAMLAALPLTKRERVAGLEPKRARVIVAGGLIFLSVLRALRASTFIVSDRGLRWGVLAERFQAHPRS